MTIYELFNKFLEQSVINGKSFFDGKTEVGDSIDALISAYIDNPLTTDAYTEIVTKKEHPSESGKSTFYNKANYQIGTLSGKTDQDLNTLKHLFASLLWLRYLPIADTKPATKMAVIEDWISKRTKQDTEEEKKDWQKQYFPSTLASYGMAQQQIDQEMVELILLYKYLRDKIANPPQQDLNSNTIKSWIIDFIFDAESGKTLYIKPQYQTQSEEKQENVKAGKNAELTWHGRPAGKHLAIHNMLLHLCDPENYEPIAIQRHKESIVKNLYPIYFSKDEWTVRKNNYQKLDEIDKLIKAIKDKIIAKPVWKDNESKPIWKSFWESPVVEQWKGSYVASSYEILNEYQKQIILYGAPGTGKTYNAKEIIKEFIALNLTHGVKEDTDNNDDLTHYKFKIQNEPNSVTKIQQTVKPITLDKGLTSKNVIWEIIQFNQSFSYEDFIEGLKPQSGGSLEVEDGVFKTFANAAKENPDKYFILIIDEINRGKIDKIFGELLYLLEYRNESLKLHYSKTDFSIPENLYIIGTMNTADKSIALLDVALRRRFWFVRCAPQIEVLEDCFDVSQKDQLKKDESSDDVKKLAIKLFKLLNDDKGILADLGADADELKIGHSYFLKILKKDAQVEEIDPTFSDLKNIWFYSIIPLLEEYCGFNKEMLSGLFKNSSYKIDLSNKENFTLEKLYSMFKAK